MEELIAKLGEGEVTQELLAELVKQVGIDEDSRPASLALAQICWHIFEHIFPNGLHHFFFHHCAGTLDAPFGH